VQHHRIKHGGRVGIHAEYCDFIIDQLGDAGEITSKAMFGEFLLYLGGKYFAGIFDNRLLFKITEAGKALLPGAILELPYEGGKPMFYIEDVEDRDLLRNLARTTCAELPAPKPGRRKSGNA